MTENVKSNHGYDLACFVEVQNCFPTLSRKLMNTFWASCLCYVQTLIECYGLPLLLMNNEGSYINQREMGSLLEISQFC